MSESMQQNPDGSWSPAVPEPFWFRRWWRWRPGCYSCSMREGREVKFRDRDEWVRHWLQHHLSDDREDGR